MNFEILETFKVKKKRTKKLLNSFSIVPHLPLE